MALDEGFQFENDVRQFLRDVGFSDVPPLHQTSQRAAFYLGGQEIDAFGRDGEFYVVVDAKTKTSLKNRRRNVRTYLSVINGYRSEVTEDIKRRYEEGHGFRDVVFVFWTKDVKIKEEDKNRASELGIVLRDNFDLLYYNQALKMLENKDIVRNGFLKDLSLQLPSIRVFLEGHSINAKAIRTRVGAKTLYTFPIEVGNLLKFAYVFRVEMNSILGESYQRLLNEKKLRKIREYVERRGGYFPNNVIAISGEQPDFVPERGEGRDASFTLGELRLPDKPCYLEILDGLHRLYGYSNLRDKQNNCLWVTIVENLDPIERAKLFVTINKTQTPVPPSILWDLYQTTDPEGIRGKISKFVYELNEIEPLKDLISLPRVRSTRAYLSFPNMCSSLASRTNLFSRYSSEDSFKNVMKAFFEAISSDTRLRVDWKRSIENKGKRGFICTNNSMSVLLRLLAKVLDKTGLPGNDKIGAWKIKLTEWVINPLIQYLEENRSDEEADPYKELRKLTSEKARKDAAEKIWEKSPLSPSNADTSY